MNRKIILDSLALCLIYLLFLRKKWWRQGMDRFLMNTLLYLYLSCVLYFTLMPVLAALPHLFDHPYIPMHLRPFDDYLHSRGDAVRQLVLNVVMTIPFGFLLPLAGRRRAGFVKTVLLTFLLSCSIELVQPLLSGARSSDITDVITNTAGGVVGYALFLLFRPLLTAVLKKIGGAS